LTYIRLFSDTISAIPADPFYLPVDSTASVFFYGVACRFYHSPPLIPVHCSVDRHRPTACVGEHVLTTAITPPLPRFHFYTTLHIMHYRAIHCTATTPPFLSRCRWSLFWLFISDSRLPHYLPPLSLHSISVLFVHFRLPLFPRYHNYVHSFCSLFITTTYHRWKCHFYLQLPGYITTVRHSILLRCDHFRFVTFILPLFTPLFAYRPTYLYLAFILIRSPPIGPPVPTYRT